MKKELHPLVQLAKQAVETYVKTGKVIRPADLTPEMKKRAGVFVTLKKHGQLRGCIGTIEPVEANIAEEIADVRIVTEQIVIALDLGDEIYKHKNEKLLRLYKKLTKENK